MTDQKLFLCTKERQLFEEVSNFYRDLIITKEKGVENLKRSNRMLENKIHKQRTELNRLNKENEDLKAENETLKEDRKHLLQDKNAVINLTKSFLDDTISCTIYEVYGMLQNYYKKLIDLNKDTNDSNTKVYLEVKKDRDNYKRLLNMYKRKSKDLYKQNQMLLQDIDEERERTRLAFKALKLQTKGK